MSKRKSGSEIVSSGDGQVVAGRDDIMVVVGGLEKKRKHTIFASEV